MDAQGKVKENARLDRVAFLDNLKWFVIILVVLMHLNVTYSGNGLWYYREQASYGPFSGLLFGLYGSLTQAYFMGLLFFISGYFSPDSLERKGPARFIRSRLIRLGVPMLAYVAIVHPLTIWTAGLADSAAPDMAGWYVDYIASLDFLLSLGPLWFLMVLLILSIAYAVWQEAVGEPGTAVRPRTPFVATHRSVAAVAVLIAVLAFLVRVVQPGGIQLFKTVPGNFMQVGFFASYVVMFAVGILCRTHDVLDGVGYRFGMRWFKWTLILGIPIWFLGIPASAIVAESHGAVPDIGAFFGGFRWQSAFYATWEAFFCVGVSLGLVVLFREIQRARQTDALPDAELVRRLRLPSADHRRRRPSRAERSGAAAPQNVRHGRRVGAALLRRQPCLAQGSCREAVFLVTGELTVMNAVQLPSGYSMKSAAWGQGARYRPFALFGPRSCACAQDDSLYI
ncbi:Acyltransferase 3 (modular protein) [uncultured Pleomorphomonas sp.]|uniref:Acyltransferase 3 (Modular protein) n=1 Tax=uncultured Pleomorphomonas sp. TaxID=442121 RepID=A0A212LPX3_9HYPH|nr:acyltransferase family protein [uncultured Pleomorphomonas sp.]SCM79531.1 Acyltransferase 3 (modular protein) [uncultured Pleomorphomonas sp.]